MSVVELLVNAGVGEIRFNRPEVLNALDLETADAFRVAVDAALEAPDVKVVVLSGAGRAFMAGGDLGAFRRASADKRYDLSRDLISAVHGALLKLENGAKPTIACVQGLAAGAGMSLALMADLAIASDDAKFNFSYVNVAASPDCGGSFALVRLVGVRRAMQIALMSESLDAREMFELGLLTKIVPSPDLRSEVFELAERLAAGPSRSLAATRRLLRVAWNASVSGQLEAEMESFATLSASGDFAEALEAFFAKRKPVFTGC